jgi:hypothetical protein
MKINEFNFNELQETMPVVDNDEMQSFCGGVVNVQCMVDAIRNSNANGWGVFLSNFCCDGGSGSAQYAQQGDGVVTHSNGQKIQVLLLLIFLLSITGCRSVCWECKRDAAVLYIRDAETQASNFTPCVLFTDRFGRTVLPVWNDSTTVYKFARPFSCGLALIADKNDEMKYIDKKGNVVIDASEYDECWGFEELMGPHCGGLKRLAYVSKYNKEKGTSRFGIINMKGQVVLPVEYEAIYGPGSNDRFLPGCDHMILAKKNELYGFLTDKVKFVTPIIYEGYGFLSRYRIR